jgi:hypothetical protein
MGHVGFWCGRLQLVWLLRGRLPFRLDRAGGTALLTWGRLVVVWGKRCDCS